MNNSLKNLYFYLLRPILLIFGLGYLLDWIFGRDRTIEQRLIVAVVGGFIVGAIWYFKDQRKKKRK